MNREIEINKFDERITFTNRGIGFSQIGVANEILNLIDDLQQENKQLQEKIDRVISFIKILQNNLKDYTEYEEYTNIFNEMLKDIEEILGDEENE